ncbi:MAG: right-handed parallel beta-helix repeat-containing protein [Clostridia bacterium]|nr:right-handed parallel beta-helix repeat-containing protein [Clostridia bacterium]
MAIRLNQAFVERMTFASFHEAEAEIKKAAALATAENPVDLEVILDHGGYSLQRPAVFSAEDIPGLAYTNLTLKAKSGMRPMLTDLYRLDNSRFVKAEGKDNYTYQFERDENGKYPIFRELFIGGVRHTAARTPLFIHPFSFAERRSLLESKGEEVKGTYLPLSVMEQFRGYDLSGVEFTLYLEWDDFVLHLERIDYTDTVEKNGETYVHTYFIESEEARCSFRSEAPAYLNIGNREVFIANSVALLNEPDSFAYDHNKGLLTVRLANPITYWTNISVPTLENLLIFKGMSNVTLENITFTGLTSKFLAENGYVAGQANTESKAGSLPHAAVLTYDTRNFTIRDCSFKDLGGNGVLMKDSTVRATVYDCRFENIAMSALSIGNPTTAWEDPKNRSFRISVHNNLFRHIAFDYPNAVAFYVGEVDGLQFTHNTMISTGYSAVSIGWGWSLVHYEPGEKVNIRHAEIAYNKFYDYMHLLRDGAAIYVLGANCTETYAERFNFMHDNYAERELFCDPSKRGYYMDGSSSNWEVYDNVTSGTHLPIFSQFHCKDQFTHHNYIHDIYTTDPVDPGNHAPWRDTVLGECYYVPEGLEALFEKYPKAKEIRDNAGCDLAY